MSVGLFVCRSVGLSVRRSVGLSVGQSVCLSVAVTHSCMYACMHVHGSQTVDSDMYMYAYVHIRVAHGSVGTIVLGHIPQDALLIKSTWAAGGSDVDMRTPATHMCMCLELGFEVSAKRS